ncbi:MAG: Thermophilic metalloprotease (M29) superfamily [Candidatus Roizmanbacteria bacterium GW2011_GWC2_34_23]|uniref:Thermophilic metalloprotease (M29) superfamily n=1 Tax=Candidatus Roizmanbacteria bacterium GW2011_GWC2_34_23 TaxID=1618484 RepID=A0A0G0AVZ8_9BACT|nr:MAG: Thermophilic metalloprotease (M29) superfamily [Candidatus Roizmanbacteria bacterium GW2011_GWC2_34_23]
MYTPDKKILEKYAKVMIDFALGKGKGVKKGEVVYLQYDSEALPLALAVYKRILEKGAYPMVKGIEESFQKVMFENASDDQLKFFPKKYTKSLVNTIDHRIYLIAPTNPFLLKNIEPKKIITANSEKQMLRRWLFEKEDKGKLTWTLCLYGTEGIAQEAGLSLKDFWQEIINACYLDQENPIKTWNSTFEQINGLIKKLNSMPVESYHLISDKTDIYISLGEKRKWQGARGFNIPSFEIFTSPDWRGVNGKIFFNFPLYRYGNIIKNIQLEFKDGIVIKATADKNEKLLQEMIKQKNANKIGEFSLTDKRFSKISKFMANTLYDENFGGEYGNSHLAVGTSFHDCYNGDTKTMVKKDWEKLGFNESVEHCDIINTNKKTVEAILKDGSKKLIYKNGLFVI